MKSFLNHLVLALLQLVVIKVFANAQETKPNETLVGRVVEIVSGDTLTVLDYEKNSSTPIMLSLKGIDCPEIKQPFGRQAKKLTYDACFSTNVKALIYSEDEYHRKRATVILPNGKNLNHELVQAGLAWINKQYEWDDTLNKYEKEAKNAEKGLWQDPFPIAPWDFRKGHPEDQYKSTIAAASTQSLLLTSKTAPTPEAGNLLKTTDSAQKSVNDSVLPAISSFLSKYPSTGAVIDCEKATTSDMGIAQTLRTQTGIYKFDLNKDKVSHVWRDDNGRLSLLFSDPGLSENLQLTMKMPSSSHNNIPQKESNSASNIVVPARSELLNNVNALQTADAKQAGKVSSKLSMSSNSPVPLAKEKQGKSSGGGFILFVAVIIIISIFVVKALSSSPSKCQVCGAGFKRDKYIVQMNEKTMIVCPKCNTNIESRISRQAVKNLFEK